MSLSGLAYFVAWLLVALIPFTLVSMLVVTLRNRGVRLVSFALAVPAWPVGVLLDALESMIQALLASEERLREGLAYRVAAEGTELYGSGFSGWDLVGPLVYFIAFCILAAAEFPIASLRFGALLGFDVTGLNLGRGTLQLLAGIIFTVTVAVWGFVAFDLLGWSPLQRPFAERPWVRRLCLAGFFASLLTGALTVLWGQLQIQNHSASILADVVAVIFGLLLFGALALSAWSLFPTVLVLTTLTAIVLRWAAAIWRWTLTAVARVLDALAAAICALIDLIAAWGRLVWNWLVRVLPERWHLSAAPEPIDRPGLFDPTHASPLPGRSGANPGLAQPMRAVAAAPEDDAAKESPAA